MKIAVTFRNTEGDEWHKEYVDGRLKKLTKYIDNPAEARVVLSVEKFRNVAEIMVTANGLNVNAKEEDKEMALAIDNAIEKIERQLKKRREKIRDHKAAGREEGLQIEDESEEGREEAGEAADDVAGHVVETRKMVLKPMSLEDAVFELSTGEKRFIIYRDSQTNTVSVLYRRDDGNFGLIETNY
jgi:putative sigma-54 modulation protein